MVRHALWVGLVALLCRPHGASQPIWLIGFQPFTGAWNGGLSVRVGAEIMLEEINAHPGLLPGYELHVVWQDNQCDGTQAEERYIENLVVERYTAFAPGKSLFELDADRDGVIGGSDVKPFEEVWNSSSIRPRPVGLLGGVCSAATMKLARIAPTVRMPQVCPAASQPALSDRSAYPSFFRTHTADTLLMHAWFAITRDMGISSAMAVLSDDGFAATAGALLAAAQSHGIELMGNDFSREVPDFRGARVKEEDPPSAAAVAADLVRYQQRVVVVGTYEATLRLVLCQAYMRNFFNAVYMVYGWVAFGWWGEKDTDCTPEQLTGMAAAHIGAAQQYFRTDTAARLSCSASMTAQQFVAEMWRRQNATPGDWSMQPAGFIPAREAATAADAVCMFAQALHAVLLTGGMALSELVERTSSSYAAMVGAFAASDFDGVAGRVRFPRGSGDPEASVLLTQMQERGGSLEMVDLATFNQNLSYLGTGEFVFQLPGEVFAAGPAGATAIGANLAQFRHCGDNEILDFRTNRCVNCPGNTTFVQSARSCLCVAGFYFVAGSGCSPCPGGTRSTAPGALHCKPCGRGTFSPPGSSECTFCPRGSFAETSGLEACRSCPPLHTTPDIASTNISSCLCRRNTYASDGSCAQCPSGSSTTGEGSASVRSCLCAKGTFMPTDARGCLPCPEGMLCPRGSSEANAAFITLRVKRDDQEFPKLLPRHWASLSEPMSVFECRSELRCPGDRYPGDACAPRLSGPSCDICIEGYGWNGAACEPCPGAAGSLFLFPVLPILLMLLAPVALYRLFGDAYERWGSWWNGVGTVAFITLNHAQLVDSLVNCNVAFPRFVKDVLGIWASSNNFVAGVSLDCRGMSDVRSSVLVRGLAPIAWAASCALTYGCSLLASRLANSSRLALDRDRLLNIYGSLLFTFFNAVTTLCLVLFKCKGNPNGTTSLHADMGIICFSSSEWQSHAPLAVALLLVYGVGVCGLFVRAVVVAPAYFRHSGFRARWKFLFIRYRADVFWWSILHLALGFLATLACVVTVEGVTQLHLMMLVTDVYMSALIVMQPYRLRIASFLDILARLSIICISALLTWHVERSKSARFVGTAVNAAVAAFSVLPAAAALCTSIHLYRFGKRFPALPAQVRRAEKEFAEMLDQIMGLSLLDSEEGAELILNLEEWDRWYLRQGTMAISADVMGSHSSWRISNKSLSQHVRSKTLVADPGALEMAVVKTVSSSSLATRQLSLRTDSSPNLSTQEAGADKPRSPRSPQSQAPEQDGALAASAEGRPSELSDLPPLPDWPVAARREALI